MQTNIQLVGSVLAALVILSLTFNFYCASLIKRRALEACWSFNGKVYLPVFPCQLFNPKRKIDKRFVTLWILGLIIGLILIAASAVWIMSVFGQFPAVFETRWVPADERNQLLLLGQPVNFFLFDTALAFAATVFVPPIVVGMVAGRTCWLAARALCVRPVAEVKSKAELMAEWQA